MRSEQHTNGPNDRGAIAWPTQRIDEWGTYKNAKAKILESQPDFYDQDPNGLTHAGCFNFFEL